MRPGRLSSTAQHIALARSWLTRAGIVDDPQAHGFLDRRHARIERALWLGRRSRPGHRPFAYIAARTRFYDALVDEGLDAGISQVVVLAAGYDSRAWRLARPGVRFFEVDHPDTQARKRRLTPPDGPTYVAADLGSVPVDQALLDAGFQPGEPAVFCCEGSPCTSPRRPCGICSVRSRSWVRWTAGWGWTSPSWPLRAPPNSGRCGP